MDIGNQHTAHFDAVFDGVELISFLVKQIGGHLYWNLRMNGHGVLLHCLILYDPHYVKRSRFDRADVSCSATTRAGDVTALPERGL